MKTKLTISFLLGLLAFAFVFTKTEETVHKQPLSPPSGLPNNNITDNFLIGSLHSATDPSFTNVNDLGLNMWHTYTGGDSDVTLQRWVPTGWTTADRLTADISTYGSGVTGILEGIDSNNGMRSLMQRPKIEWLCFGQRSDYQCEDAADVDDDLFFYTFQSPYTTGESRQDNTIYGNGIYAKRCLVSADDPGFVVSRLKCNTEQSKPSGSGNQWQADGDCTWFIKPRIRIDSTVADNPLNWNNPVCSLTVKNDIGFTIKNVILKVRHFIDDFGNYDGHYKEEFRYEPGDDTLLVHGSWGKLWEWRSRGDWTVDSVSNIEYRSKADIQVYWYGNCDMWIDYVRVDNDVAHNLFGTGQTHELYEDWIEWEVQNIVCNSDATKNTSLKFYIELIEFNNIPCISYVSRKLDSLTKLCNGGRGVDMVTDLTYHYAAHVNWDNKNAVMNAGHIKRNYIDKINAKQIFMESYPLTSTYYHEPGENNTYSRIPITLSTNSGREILAWKVSPAEYDEWLQGNLDFSPSVFEDYSTEDISVNTDGPEPCDYSSVNPWQDPGNFRFTMQTAREISKAANIPFIYMQQAHHWFTPGEVRREPTNEEMSLLTNLSVSYGAKGIVYYWFANHSNDVDCDYSYGLTNTGNQKRMTNVYGQPKWDTMKSIISRLKKWDPYLMSFDNEQINSYIYYNPSERTSLFSNSYFSDVVTYYPYDNPQPCQEDSPGIDSPTGLQYDCKNARYVQVATFEKEENDGYKYFMIVNRRCSPFINDNNLDNNGGRRLVKVKFGNHSGHLGTPNNWTIFDVTNTRTPVAQFTVTSNQWADLGWFMPGEGRIYKMAPTPKTGGTLLADEHISGQSFTCEDTVISNGFDITIDEGSVISFTDSATIIMNGGTFTSGGLSESSQPTTYKGVGSGKWNGMRFNGTDVKIYNSKFQDIASPCVNYAISMVDCQLADIRTNQFVLNTDTAGAIQSVYIEDPFGSPSYTGLHINYNSITMANSRGNAIAVQGFSGITLPLYAGNNTMTSNGYATGILLSTITGGVVKNNSITGFSTGINTLLSTIDVYGNTISNTSSVSKGIISTGLSSSGLLPASGLWLGGMNTITNTSGASTNIEVNNSVFSLESGNNTFDATSTSGAYHLYGTFWDSTYNNKQRYNCFKLGGSTITSPTNPNYSISIGFASLTLNFIDYTCNATPPEDETVVDLGNGLYDTIPYTGGGEGGSAIGNKQLTISNKSKSKSSANHLHLTKGETQRGLYAYILSNSALYDSIRIQIRKKNYNAAKESCYELIDTYPDSSESISALSYLFLSQTTADTTQTAIGNLKSYYEGLILNHGSNTAMVTMCNYLVQKCKVKLHQYTSALSGFQEIINNNPYSYEGLLAKWDYMATSLLVQGQGGSEKEIADLEAIDRLMGWNDRTPLTKEERKTIRQTVINTREIIKNDREAKIKILEERTKTGDKGSEKELRTLKTLKDINKSVKPSNVFEHINIVSGDIQKVFATDVVISSRQENLIPSVFSLSQNYPNPFNPVTTIKYALPHDVKVVVRIYDILGREVKVLVNELQKAGYYDAKFDGSNFASGVYFYRIEAGDFVLAKKMVLVK